MLSRSDKDKEAHSSESKGGASSRRFRVIVMGVLFLFLLATYVVVIAALRPPQPGRELSVNELYELVERNDIADLTFLREDTILVGTTDEGRQFWTGVVGAEHAGNVLDTLTRRGTGVRVDVQSAKRLLRDATNWALPIATMIVGFAFLFEIFRSGGEFGLLGRSKARRYQEGSKRVTFNDVAGLTEAVEELREVKDFLTNPEGYERLGAHPPRGILLLGPPGCGKTLLARAVAGEAGVPFFSISASEFVEMLAGVGAARIRDLFEKAKEAAPAIVFIDEIDAIGRERASGHSFNVEWEASLNELLVQIDGFDPTSRVVLMAATNRADILDSALVRKGRFDRQVVVDLPDYVGRLAILKVHAKGKLLAPDADLDRLARRTAGFSGADIAAVMNEGALLAGRRRQHSVRAQDLTDAIDRVLAGLERRSVVLGEEEKQRVAYHEAGHALTSWVLNQASTIDKVSIVARGRAFGLTWQLPTEDRHFTTRSQLEQELSVLLAGRASEDIVFADPSDGARDDLSRATRIAHEMVCNLGMSEAVGLRVVRTRQETGLGEMGDGPAESVVVKEVARLLDEADARCRHVLTENRTHLDRLAEMLVRQETLERADIVAILGDVRPDLAAI